MYMVTDAGGVFLKAHASCVHLVYDIFGGFFTQFRTASQAAVGENAVVNRFFFSLCTPVTYAHKFECTGKN
jgi:hypothetical protein